MKVLDYLLGKILRLQEVEAKTRAEIAKREAEYRKKYG
jgi:hypothetical protein